VILTLWLCGFVLGLVTRVTSTRTELLGMEGEVSVMLQYFLMS